VQILQSFPLPQYTGTASGAGIVADSLFGASLMCTETDTDLVNILGPGLPVMLVYLACLLAGTAAWHTAAVPMGLSSLQGPC
jgi:hypothetical protein